MVQKKKKNSQDSRLQENHGLQNSPWRVGVNHIWPLAYSDIIQILM